VAGDQDTAEVLEPEAEERESATLDPERAARREAALRQVRQWGDPVLTTPARHVERFDDQLLQEVARMERIMEDAIGLGLAATQLGVLHRLLIYRPAPGGPLAVLANPEIAWRSQESEVFEEGCLSIPGVVVDVERPIHVRVLAQDEEGEQITIEASGLEARVIQHEVDHLDGVLMLDRTTRDQRKQAIRALREREAAA
jgi:peptide deformylase